MYYVPYRTALYCLESLVYAGLAYIVLTQFYSLVANKQFQFSVIPIVSASLAFGKYVGQLSNYCFLKSRDLPLVIKRLIALEERRVVSCLSRDAFVDRIDKEVNLAARARQYLKAHLMDAVLLYCQLYLSSETDFTDLLCLRNNWHCGLVCLLYSIFTLFHYTWIIIV